MTAQTVLMNKFAIAIASDSVVSIERGDGVYQTKATSEKLIPLSGNHDVALMVSGVLTLKGIPFPVLISEWSKTLDVKFNTLEEYLPSFLEWLENRNELQSIESDEQLYGHILDDILKDIWDSTIEFDLSSEENIFKRSAIEDQFLNNLKSWKNYSYSRLPFKNWNMELAKNLSKANFSEVIEDRISYWFDDRPMTESSSQLLFEICESIPAWLQTDIQTDIVAVGFGAEDLLPKTSFVSLYGILKGQLRNKDIEFRSIRDSGSYYNFFGQWDASIQFIRGLDPDMKDKILNYFEKFTRNLISAQSMFDEEEGDEDLEAVIKDHVRNSTNELNQIIESHSKDNFENPLIQVIALSPEADLAKLAKSLIEIQAIRQSINQVTPTVGGPIDVAVITKINGFQWINHKSITLPFS